MAALTKRSQSEAVAALAAEDADIADIVRRCGAPQLWSRPPGFSTLVYIVLEQQVSLASARTCYQRLLALQPDLSPAKYLRLSDEQLRGAGLSSQKIRYTRLIAAAILDDSLPIDKLGRLADDRVRELLTAITGVGNWTADIYLMAALRRPDLWPIGDLALVKALQEIKGVALRPSADMLLDFGERYRPYRSVATRIFWMHYLHK